MNKEFLLKMKEYLNDDYEEYLTTLDNPFKRGLRVNTLKISSNDFLKLNVIDLKPTKVSSNVFEINSSEKIGNTFEHKAGLFYLQEVSACTPVEILDPQPEEYVLDLCAAPGGKSTQIAMKMDNKGLLISNEINNSRAQILLGNMERIGVSNALITNSSVEKLCDQLVGSMDKVLVDAPCSGEGMFKKEDAALKDWSIEHVKACAIRQKKIIDSAVKVLKEDGILVYSTCTYSKEENEEVIDYLLQNHPEFELLSIDVDYGRKGLDCGLVDGNKVLRIYPMDIGEGHFVAKLRKLSSDNTKKINTLNNHELPSVVKEFMKCQIDYSFKYYYVNDNKVYASNTPFVDLKSIHVIRQGVLLGEIVKDRFEPHQHMYVCALLNNHFNKITSCSHEELLKYLHGNQLTMKTDKGYRALMYNGYVFGFGKSDGAVIKNKYPKGLRLKGV